MNPLAWLAFPVLAVLAAMIAVTWAGRPKPRAQARASVRQYELFKAAFAATHQDRDDTEG